MKKIIKGKEILFYFLVVLGIFLRIVGFFYLGNDNLTDYRRIGHEVYTKGLTEGFGQGYFILSFVFFGINYYLTGFTPSNWWWSWKASNFIFEFLILVLLLKYLKKFRWQILFMYWLNPWFLIPGAWGGFWDAPNAAFILLSLISLESGLKKSKRFILSGLFMGIALTIKPQTLVPIFVLSIYFLIKYVFHRKFREVLQFYIPLILPTAVFSFYVFLGGKPIYHIVKWYAANMIYTMPYLDNSEINIWHTVTRIIMYFKKLEGPLYTFNTYTFPYNLMEYLAGGVFLILIYIVIRKYAAQAHPKFIFWKMMSFAFILLPQIGTRSHVYHFYYATLLLIPIILSSKNKKLYYLWLISTAIHFYNFWWQYGCLGSGYKCPVAVWGEPVLSILGFLQFLFTLGFIYLFLNSELDV